MKTKNSDDWKGKSIINYPESNSEGILALVQKQNALGRK